MNESLLRVLLVINGLTIAGYAIAAWGAKTSPPSLTVTVVAAMALQIILVLQPKRDRSAHTTNPSTPDH